MNRQTVVAEQLEKVVGVNPSSDWLTGCSSFLKDNEVMFQNGNTIDALASDILGEIIHNDLRDVVRYSERYGRDNMSQNAKQLRQSIKYSMDCANSYKASLPETFRLLVQIEEYTDMSSPLEKRLAMFSNGSQTSLPQHSESVDSRCLKLSYSDGYSCPDLMLSMVAMEIRPLNGLGTKYSLLAGLKVILHGSIVIRHGVAGWHPGNATVIGGNVERMIEIQSRALSLAKEKAGHGVDPTIKALIWNNPNHPQRDWDVEAEDEAEHESRDVMEIFPQPHQQQQQVSHTNQNYLRSEPIFVHQRSNGESCGNQSRDVVQPSLQKSDNNIENRLATASQTVPPNALNPLSNIRSNLSNFLSSKSSNQLPGGNAYQRQSFNVMLDQNFSSTNNHMMLQAVVEDQCTTTKMSNSLVQNQSSAIISSRSTSGPYSAQRLPTNNSIVIEPASASNEVSGCEGEIRKATRTSFDELRELVLRAIENEGLYRNLFGKVYIVDNVVQCGSKLYFNIEKIKSQSGVEFKTKSDKYEYVMTAKIQQYKKDSGVITCKVSSQILEPYFNLPPGEMRKLNKQDRTRSEIMVKEGGQRLNVSMLQPHSYEIKLLKPPEEFFDPSNSLTTVDGAVPFMELLSRL